MKHRMLKIVILLAIIAGALIISNFNKKAEIPTIPDLNQTSGDKVPVYKELLPDGNLSNITYILGPNGTHIPVNVTE